MTVIANVNITIKADKNEFKSGEGINLSITLTNSGADPVTVVQRSEWLNHILSVTDARGKEVPETAHAKQVKDAAQVGYRATRQIMPGEALTETLDLDKAFKLREPGTYKITSRRGVSPTKTFERPVSVKSNELIVRVVP
jgi:hypothetical protein